MNGKFPSPKNNHILYLDTSEPKAVIALVDSGLEWPTFHFRRWEADRELSKNLSQKVEKILNDYQIKKDELAGICVFVGPGSFTGLRIGISFVNALAFALGIPVYETRTKETFSLNDPKKTALPFYGSEPKITQPKKKF